MRQAPQEIEKGPVSSPQTDKAQRGLESQGQPPDCLVEECLDGFEQHACSAHVSDWDAHPFGLGKAVGHDRDVPLRR